MITTTTKPAKAPKASAVKYPHQKAYQERLHKFRDEALAQRTRLERLEAQVDLLAELLGARRLDILEDRNAKKA
jgi:hypothetical protein